MLSPENINASGMASDGTGRRPSAVSQALRAMTSTGDELKRLDLPHGTKKGIHQILVASNRVLRERAYALAHRIYSRAGYAPADGPKFCVSRYDASPETLTLLAVDTHGNDVATISLVFESPAGLPCDEIYRLEVDALRAHGCLLAEVTRLAIAESCTGAKELLLDLFNHCYVFARIVRGYTDLLVEVNPRHVKYYQRLLHFEQVGPERSCSRVQGAPAMLLRLNISAIEAAVKETGCTHGRGLDGRRLHSYPYSHAEEEVIAQILVHAHRPMNVSDARHFGLNHNLCSDNTVPPAGNRKHGTVIDMNSVEAKGN